MKKSMDKKMAVELLKRGRTHVKGLYIDVFDVNGEYYISEVNPRFGGGYPHAYESGANHMRLIVNNLAGKTNECAVGKNYEVGTYMMKYNEIMIQHNR